MLQRAFHTHLRIAGKHCEANFIRRGRRHVNLATLAPIHFDELAPGSNSEMTAEPKTRRAHAPRTKPRPFPHDGSLPVRSHEPVKRKPHSIEPRVIGVQFGNPSTP